MMKTSRLRYGILIRLEITNKPGMLGRVTSAIGKAGGDIGAIDIVGFRDGCIIRDLTVTAGNQDMEQRITANIGKINGVSALSMWPTARSWPIRAEKSKSAANSR